jgi:hypothetical protein
MFSSKFKTCKFKTFLALILVLGLFGAFASTAAAATTYELQRIDIYDYYDTGDSVSISGSGITDSMSKVVAWQTVKINATVSNGTYEIEGANLDGKYYVATLNKNYVDLTIRVLDKDGNLQKRYYLQLRKSLEGIESVVFSGDDYSYTFDTLASTNTLTVPAAVTNLKMKVNVSSSDYIVKYNTKEASGNIWDIDVPNGSSVPLYITVSTKSDPDNYTQYKIELSKLSGSATAQGSLSALKISSGSNTYDLFPTFDPQVYNYYVCLPNGAREVTLTPTLGNNGTSVAVNGTVVANGKASNTISASTSGTAVTVTVTDLNNQINVYTINLLRTPQTEGSDAVINDLQVKSGTSRSESSLLLMDTTPVFSSNTTQYELVMDSAYSYFSFRPAITGGAVFLITDKNVVRLTESKYSDVVQLGIGDTPVLRVYSADFKSYKDYNFTVSARELDGNYLLDSLTVKIDGMKVGLSPSFARTTYSYTTSADESSKVYTITAKAASDTTKITVNGSTVASETESGEFALGDTNTTVTIVSTAENGESATYKLTIDRNGIVGGKIVLRIGSKTYIKDGESKSLAAAPYISNSRTQVPVRVIAEALGASVYYDSSSKQITIKKDDERMYMEVGKIINGFDVAPEIKNNTTFVPIRYVSEKLQCKCVYNSDSKEIIITYGAE